MHVVRRRVLSMSNLMGGARRLDEGEQSTQDVKSPVSPATHCYEPQKSPLMADLSAKRDLSCRILKGSRCTNLTTTKRGRLNARAI